MAEHIHDDLMHDRELLARLRAGDSAAFDTLYLTYHARLVLFAAQVTAGAVAADDVVQDVFLSLWTRRAEHTIVPPIAAYLYGAVRKRAWVMRRNADTARRITTRLTDAGVAPGVGAFVDDPEQRLANADMRAALQRAIAALPERQRLALRLRMDDRLDVVAIAEALGVTERAVRKLLAKAIETLSDVLDRAEA